MCSNHFVQPAFRALLFQLHLLSQRYVLHNYDVIHHRLFVRIKLLIHRMKRILNILLIFRICHLLLELLLFQCRNSQLYLSELPMSRREVLRHILASRRLQWLARWLWDHLGVFWKARWCTIFAEACPEFELRHIQSFSMRRQVCLHRPIVVTQSSSRPKSRAHAARASVSAEEATIAYSSASAKQRATTFCWRQYVFRTCSPRHTAPPLVDLAVREHPAQSQSVKDVNRSGGSCQANLMTSRGAPIRCLPILRSCLLPDALGALMHRAGSFTAYPMSGRSGAM